MFYTYMIKKDNKYLKIEIIIRIQVKIIII